MCSEGVRSCNIAFTRLGKCLRAGHRAKLRGKDHRQFLGEGDETFMEESGKNAVLEDLTTHFVTPYFLHDPGTPKTADKSLRDYMDKQSANIPAPG